MRRIPRGQLYFDPGHVLRAATSRILARPSAGAEVRELERAFAAALDAPAAIALPHARVALQQLLRVLALPRGSEVLMTPVTIPEIVSVLLMEGLRPVFVDLGERTCNVDVRDLERKITPATRLVLVTHLCGFPSEMERIMALATQHGLQVLEDCSQVPGARHRGVALGLWGRAGFMSLTPLKPVSTLHGGMTVSRDPALVGALRRLDDVAPPPLPRRHLLRLLARDHLLHAITQRDTFSRLTYHVVRAGEAFAPTWVRELQRGNLLNASARRWRVERLARLPGWMYARYGDLQAATGLPLVAHLEAGNARRRLLSISLLELLEEAGVPGLVRPTADLAECTFWRFPLWVEPTRLPALRRHLLRAGVDTAATNLACASREPAFTDLAASTPNAVRFVDEMIFLPMHPNLDEADMRLIAEAVAAFYA